ncbi:hypothetical protein HYALB_00013095 [Hymenoscyphus albidus]|uniref:Uncharacterized protein n=1 Tax=Hymenoscyphus albidus TaxID=595503 RepID=A0A9N9LSL2_9HELO|nr:hypothetical protein HYALB_00013095 [Hymenoscyphus albidus]
MSSDASLYGIRKPKSQPKQLSSSTSLAFTSTLSSLLSTPSTRPTHGRPRPSKTPKDDIFSTHNRNTKKRALADLESDDDEATRSRGRKRENLGEVNDTLLHLSNKKLERKARLYREMKRGEYIVREGEPGEDLVDFDRKWVEGGEREGNSSSDSEGGDEGGEIVDYEDEYGRLRRGTKADAERMERRKLNKVLREEELDRISARPSMPEKLIYGDTVQTQAFNPDAPVLEKMKELAGMEDLATEPPPQLHYEADKEFRIKGVGFYSFSKDEATRKQEMESLEAERLETERKRREREEKKELRKREIEERRKAIGEKRARKQAESFLEGLGNDLTPSVKD